MFTSCREWIPYIVAVEPVLSIANYYYISLTRITCYHMMTSYIKGLVKESGMVQALLAGSLMVGQSRSHNRPFTSEWLTVNHYKCPLFRAPYCTCYDIVHCVFVLVYMCCLLYY